MGTWLLLPAHRAEQLFAGRHRSRSRWGRRYPAPRAGRVGEAEQRSTRSIPLNACVSLWAAGICGEQPCGTWCRSAAALTLRVPAWRLGAHDRLPLPIHSLMFPVSLSRNNLTSGKRNQRWPQLLCVLCKQPHRQNNLLLQPGQTTRSCPAAGSRGADTHLRLFLFA